MTTYLEHSTTKQSNFITTAAQFPIGKIGPTLHSIIQSAMNGVIIVNAMRQIVLVNRKVESIFGYPAAQLLEKPLDLLMPPRAGNEQRRRIDRLAATRMHGSRTKLELKGIRANGDHLSLSGTVSRVTVHGELFLALILQEPVMHASSEKYPQDSPLPSSFRKWGISSQQASEIEKRRFSKKLYDDIGQRLSVLKLDLDWLENSLPAANECVPERLAQMQGLLDNVIAMTKNVASALRPPLLDDFGLIAAVEWMAETFQKRTSIRCSLEIDGLTTKLDDAVESAVFRIVQEGLTNIERHSHASNARLVLLHAHDQLDVMILDDGIGMAHGSETRPGCYGLTAMQERIFVLGGTISIQNAEPHGVIIHAAIPIETGSSSNQ